MATNGHIQIGQLGENIAVGYLQNRGFRVVERNYRKKWGEIDIIVEKDSVFHFVEVKSASVSREFSKEGSDRYRPEDHMDRNKKKRLKRAIETYIQERNVLERVDAWTLDLVVVEIDKETRKARVDMIVDVLLD